MHKPEKNEEKKFIKTTTALQISKNRATKHKKAKEEALAEKAKM